MKPSQVAIPLVAVLALGLLLAPSCQSAKLREPVAGMPVEVFTNTHGTSMEPMFRAGDAVHYQRLPFPSLQVGDVVAFWREHPSNIAVHEVIERGTWGWRTQGINNLRADHTLVTPENYIGVAVHPP